jgi:hypothetical protein
VTEYSHSGAIKRFDLSGIHPNRLKRLMTLFRPRLMQKAQDRADWQAAIGCDTRLNRVDIHLGIIIIEHLNLKTQRCFPTQDVLSQRLRIAGRHIIKKTQKLEALGWFRIGRARHIPGHKGRLANEYSPGLPDELREAIKVTFSAIKVTFCADYSDPQRSPLQGSILQGSIQHSVLRTASACADAIDSNSQQEKRDCRQDGPSGRERKDEQARPNGVELPLRSPVSQDMVDDGELVREMMYGSGRGAMEFRAVMSMAKTREEWNHIDGARLANLINAGLLQQDYSNGRGVIYAPEREEGD